MSYSTSFSSTTAMTQIVEFIKNTFVKCNKNFGVIAVSGGIDSAVSLNLLVQALGKDKVTTLLMPYAGQDMGDAELALDFCQIPKENRKKINIQPLVDQLANLSADNGIQSNSDKQKRLGNIMARVRMTILYDWAAKLDALVCGTENKSERYLGYFTRFGDQASDLEPIAHLYKTQVLALAKYMNLPERLITKPPSAELWPNQTDETELGFTYAQADLVLQRLVDDKIPAENIVLENVDPETVQKIINRVGSQAFKQQVPYEISEKKIFKLGN